MMKTLLIGVGTISVVLGVIGIFLPLIPTTPFVLLAGACYLRSSEKHHQRLLANPWLGPYLKDYYEDKGIPLRAKIISIALLWLSLSASMFFLIELFWVRILLGAIGVGVTIYILSQKTKIPERLVNTFEQSKMQEGSTEE
ncbi:MAG: YbaN family protein [Desulfitobacterium sp.]